jgi:hypothetical protein
MEILQLPALSFTSHSRPCRTLVSSLSTDNCQLRKSQSISLLQQSNVNYLLVISSQLSKGHLKRVSQLFIRYITSGRTKQKIQFLYCCMRVRFRGNLFIEPSLRNCRLLSRLCHNNGFIRYDIITAGPYPRGEIRIACLLCLF